MGFLVSSSLIGLLLIPILGRKAHRPMMAVYKFWSAFFFIAAGIRVKVFHRERLFQNLPAIVVCNHCSNMDMFIGAYSQPINIKPLAKVQLKKMPLLGFLFSTVCVLVDRSSKESRERSSRAMREELQRGNSIFIFPEGTRNTSNQPLNAFYDGAFRFAIESGYPVVALCSINARSLVPSDSYSVRPGTLELQYLGPYETKGLRKDDVDALKQQVWNDMNAVLASRDRMFRAS
jgi:1-acyl-sn-glycerol-3-phosphate acyltransferase